MVSRLHIQSFQAWRVGDLKSHIDSSKFCVPQKGSTTSGKKNNLFTGVDFDFQLMDFLLEQSVPSKSGTNNIHRPTAGMAPTKKGWQKTTSGIRDNDNVVILSKSDIYKLY